MTRRTDVLTTAVAAPVLGSNGERYSVTVHIDADGYALFTCDHPAVLGFGRALRSAAPGDAPCKHCEQVASKLANYLTRDDLGLWHVTPAGHAVTQTHAALAAAETEATQ